eukprot:PITA_27006
MNKTGEIHLRIDFRNLNKVSLKDNYPLPKMDHILQRVVGASRISLLDGYSGYNQILVHEDDRDKTTFTTPWGKFHYAKMSFGLKNEGATFQHAMDVAFANEKDIFLVVYLDDLTVFSNSDEEHLYHLKIVFQKCRKYGISLNSKKSLFSMDEGKLLGHIISKEDICIDPARVEAIQQIEQPRNKKEIQSFNGKLNFLRRFIPNLAEHLREITSMPKKYSQALKDFRVYILHSHILAYVPNAAVKDILVQADPEGRRGKWIAALLEYDVEIKPTKLIKGQGLAKIMVETNLQVHDINLIASMSDEDEENPSVQVSEMFLYSPWHADILYVLQHLSSPPGMPRNKSITLKLKAAKFYILDSTLYWKDPRGMLLNCLVEEEAKRVVDDFHRGDCGGHLFWKTTANKILRACYYWPSLFSDVYKAVKNCHECQIFEGKQKLQPFPLKPIEISRPFQQWGLDFIGEIHSASSGQHRWILIATDYFRKWIEAIPTRQAMDAVIISFLETNILSCFGCSNTVFPTSLAVPVVKLLQEVGSEEDPMQRRINQMIHLQQTREEVFQNTCKFQERIKRIYYRKAKADTFHLGEVVLRWDARHEDKGKHGKFETLWKGPYKIAAYHGQNAFLLKEMNGDECPGGPINGKLLKRYYF